MRLSPRISQLLWLPIVLILNTVVLRAQTNPLLAELPDTIRPYTYTEARMVKNPNLIYTRDSFAKMVSKTGDEFRVLRVDDSLVLLRKSVGDKAYRMYNIFEGMSEEFLQQSHFPYSYDTAYLIPVKKSKPALYFFVVRTMLANAGPIRTTIDEDSFVLLINPEAGTRYLATEAFRQHRFWRVKDPKDYHDTVSSGQFLPEDIPPYNMPTPKDVVVIENELKRSQRISMSKKSLKINDAVWDYQKDGTLIRRRKK